MNIQTEFTRTTQLIAKILIGYLAWDDSIKEAMPGVLVFPEWWG